MTKQLAMALAIATGTVAVHAAVPYQSQAKAYLERQQANPMRYARQSKSASAIDIAAVTEARTGAQKIAPAKQLPVCDLYTILDGPNGEVWTCTYDYEIEKIQHEYYIEDVYKGVTLSVFNEKFELLGTVTDHFELGEGISGVAQIMVDPVVTQKFFNYDSSYEIALMVSYNTPVYVNINKTYIY